MAAKKMKAAVLREFGKPLTIEEKAVPEPGPGEGCGGRKKKEPLS